MHARSRTAHVTFRAPTTMDDPTASDRAGLHRHLSVVRADATGRRDLLRALCAPATGPVIDLTGAPVHTVTAEDLAGSVHRHGERRDEHRRRDRARVEGERRVAQVRLDHARTVHEQLLDRARRLDEAIGFATDAVSRLERFAEESAGAMAELAAAADDRADAQEALEHLRGQREDAAAAMAQAGAELDGLGVAHFDEPGLRRELEAGTSAVTSAESAVAAVRSRLDELARRLAGRRTALDEIVAEHAALVRARDEASGPDPAQLAELAAALDAYDDEASYAHLDGRAADLHDLLDRIEGELAQVELPAGPDPAELAAARAELDSAMATLRETQKAGGDRLSAQDRARIEAAHDAVLAAEEARGRGAAQRLSEARAAEAAVLDELGFASRLEVVLGGGRHADSAARSLANQHRAARALARVEALEAAALPAPEVARLLTQRDTAVAEAARLLRVEPGPDARALLAGHRAVEDRVIDRLRDALAAVAGRAEGERLEVAARRVLGEHHEQAAWRDDVERHLVRLDGQAAELRREVEELESAVAAGDTDLRAALDREQAARRALAGLEGELAARSGEDARRLHRVAAAEQLRAQIDALGRALDQAEEAAAERLADAERRCLAGEELARGFETVVSDTMRRAREVADDLAPGTVRGGPDPIAELAGLADALRSTADRHAPQLSVAHDEVRRCRDEVVMVDQELARLGDVDAGIHPDDRAAGLADLLAAAGRSLVVLDEPFGDVDDAAHDRLTKTVQAAAAERPVVLLTEDPRTLGWAIGLPHAEGAVVALDTVISALTAAASGPSTALPTKSTTTTGPSLTVAPVGSPGRTDS